MLEIDEMGFAGASEAGPFVFATVSSFVLVSGGCSLPSFVTASERQSYTLAIRENMNVLLTTDYVAVIGLLAFADFGRRRRWRNATVAIGQRWCSVLFCRRRIFVTFTIPSADRADRMGTTKCRIGYVIGAVALIMLVHLGKLQFEFFVGNLRMGRMANDSDGNLCIAMGATTF